MRIDGLEFVARALTYQGKPYIWGAKGRDSFDCSGLVTLTILDCGGPDMRDGFNAHRLFKELDSWLPQLDSAFPAEIPREVALALAVPSGTLVFYGQPGSIDHVMMASGDGRVFGACGGNRDTLTPKPGACVQFRASVAYRPVVRGFRRLPEVKS